MCWYRSCRRVSLERLLKEEGVEAACWCRLSPRAAREPVEGGRIEKMEGEGSGGDSRGSKERDRRRRQREKETGWEIGG